VDKALTDLGVGGILVVLVLRQVFDFVRGMKCRKNGINTNGVRCGFDEDRDEIRDLLKEIARNTKELADG
jgi:hypothetical protein